MYLCQKNQIRRLSRKQFDTLWYLTRLAKNVYNESNYTFKKWYEINDETLSYGDLCFIAKNSVNYQKMPSQVGQQVIKILVKSWKSFFKLLKERKKGNFNQSISSPKYLKTNSHFILIFQQNSFKIIDNGKTARLSLGNWYWKERNLRYLFFTVPPHIRERRIKEIHILPRYNGHYFEIEFVYEIEAEKHELERNKYLGIDIGLNNFATCIDTDGNAFIMEGSGIKSFNRWWNKKKVKLQSVHKKLDINYSQKLVNLSKKRVNKIRNFMAQTVNYIIKHCIKNKIGNVIIGELKGIKQYGNLGKVNNQNFQSIPFSLFKQKLKTKCDLHNINYYEINEAYTSQTCSVCGKRKKSNRIYRGAYYCYCCKNFLNADVNGAINILKKVVPKSITIGNSGIANIPVRIRLII